MNGINPIGLANLTGFLGKDIEVRTSDKINPVYKARLTGVDTNRGVIFYKTEDGSEFKKTIKGEVTSVIIPGIDKKHVLNKFFLLYGFSSQIIKR